MESQPSHSGIDSNAQDEQQQQQHKDPQPKEQQQQQAPPPAMMPPPGMPPPPVEFMVPHTQLELGHSMARPAYPYPDPYFGSIVAAYGPQAMIHPHLVGVQQAGLPLPSDTIEEPVYVNAKQYHGILRRRQSRAKAESENKLIKCRKPYLHESRHLHALKRARGCGGRFLNAKAVESNQDQASGERNSHDANIREPSVDKPESVKEVASQKTES